MKGLMDSCCFRLSATWAMTPAPALCSHSLFTWTNNISHQENMDGCMHKDFGKEGCWIWIIHEYCYGQRMAKMLNESWHQLSSTPTSVSRVSFPLMDATWKINTMRKKTRSTTTYTKTSIISGCQLHHLPSMISWYSAVFFMLGEDWAASFALAASGGNWGPSDDTGGQYSTSTTCL